jgi:hypothetical protein
VDTNVCIPSLLIVVRIQNLSLILRLGVLRTIPEFSRGEVMDCGERYINMRSVTCFLWGSSYSTHEIT